MKTDVGIKMDMRTDVPFSRTYRNKNMNKERKVYLSYSVFPFLSAHFMGNKQYISNISQGENPASHQGRRDISSKDVVII